MDNWVSFVIWSSLVNGFEKRKINTDIEYNFNIRFVSHPSLFFWREKQTVRNKREFRRLFKIKMWKLFDSSSKSRYGISISISISILILCLIVIEHIAGVSLYLYWCTGRISMIKVRWPVVVHNLFYSFTPLSSTKKSTFTPNSQVVLVITIRSH